MFMVLCKTAESFCGYTLISVEEILWSVLTRAESARVIMVTRLVSLLVEEPLTKPVENDPIRKEGLPFDTNL